MSIRLIINPLASYLFNCVAELQRSVLGVGINRYVENLKKCNDRQVLGLSEKNNKKHTLRSTSGMCGKISVFCLTPFFLGGGQKLDRFRS